MKNRYIFTALFTVVVVVVMLNLLVSLLNDLYEELKALATADWCRAQVTFDAFFYYDTLPRLQLLATVVVRSVRVAANAVHN